MVRPDGTRKISCSIDGANPADITDLTQQAKQHKDDGTVGVCLFKLVTLNTHTPSGFILITH